MDEEKDPRTVTGLDSHVCWGSAGLMYPFGRKIRENCGDKFSAKDLDELGRFLGVFSSEGEDGAEWEDTYEKSTGKLFSNALKLLEEELLTNIIASMGKYIYSWGFDIPQFLDLLFKMRYKPEESEKEISIWRQELENPLSTYFLCKKDPSDLAEKICLKHPDNKRFSDKEGWQLATYFLDKLLDSNTNESYPLMRKFLQDFFTEATGLKLWKEAYKQAFGRNFSNNNPLTAEEIFTLIIEVCAMHTYKIGLDLKALIRLFFLIPCEILPEDITQEIALWNQVLTEYSTRS